ncbi:MAG: hypothetical protein U1E56_07135 [Bauldia sp.]
MSYAGRAARLLAFLVPLLIAGRADAWDSIKHNPTHPTHSYLTEYAIDQLAAARPELRQYRAAILAGANQELHELSVTGTAYGVDLDAKRREHRGTNAGTDDIAGWWREAVDAYRSGNKERAYFVIGILLHFVEDMGVPAHANGVYHQGNATEFDNFEFLGLSNWKPSFAAINRADPGYAEPWRYYDFSRDWAAADAPSYRDRDSFSKTWVLASAGERALLQNRQGRTATVALWTLRSAHRALTGR